MDPTAWLPFLSDVPPKPRPIREAATQVAPFRDAYTPAPDILAALTFFPVLAQPPQPRPRRARQEAVVIVEPFDVPTRIDPAVWQPRLAGPLPRPDRPRQERVTIDPTFGAGLLIASTMAWAPHLPDQPRPPRSTRGPGPYTTVPSVIAAAVPCVDLVDTSLTTSTLLTDTVAETDLSGEALTTPVLLGGAFC